MSRRGRDSPFSMMGGRSNSASDQFSGGGKQQPQQYHNHNGFAESSDFDRAQPLGAGDNYYSHATSTSSDFDKAPPLRAGDNYYRHATSTSRDDPLHEPYEFSSMRGKISEMPYEFSSMRGKICEIPGFGREGGDEGNQSSKCAFQGPDFSSWLGGIKGLVNSVVGKRTGGGGFGAGGQSGNGDEKKELVADIANRTLQMIKEQTAENGFAKSSEAGLPKTPLSFV